MSAIGFWTIILAGIGLANSFDKKGCNFNDAILNPKVFQNNACWKCYENLTDKNRLQKVYCLVKHDGLNFTVNGFLIRDRCVPFDYKSSLISELVQSSVSSEVYELWIKCCSDAKVCCEKMIENYQAENFFNTCESHWDGYSCFNETLPGGYEKKNCPYSMKKNDDSKCEYSYTKSCQYNGTWTKSDFSQCYQHKRLTNYIEWHIALFSISLIFCLLPILSPIMSRTFHSKHSKTLFALIIFVALRNILKLTIISMIFIDTSTETFNNLGCRLISSFTQFCNNMIYVCIALLALKLLQILKNTTENWGMFILLSIGLILTCMSTILWSFMMKIYADKLCWLIDHENHWINDSFNFLLLLVAGVLFLLCLYHKSEKYDENVVHFLKMFIIPLSIFIAPFVLTLISSFVNCCSWEDFFNLLITFIMLLQAISLCIIFFISSKSNLNHNHSYWSVTKYKIFNTKLQCKSCSIKT
ncbi:hypothetical protein PVAND_012166 [Polypedilum vanderplanki]|uniref:G-protein coupled receptors family 2 profile 1 domain-containing protein n=1 Tax=Polypedilum vanderplanki TaxID=319348 RepID=A0A9J6CLK4_POLVA|nr:hypothetical protein PVAND_012166 [Polypedilum vanderplanki]